MSKSSKSQPKMLLIEWEDAFSGPHVWMSIKDIPKKISGLMMKTVGFEIRRSKHRVTLAMAYDPDNGKASDFFTIPVGMIRKETALD